jgi:hypothetical protein
MARRLRIRRRLTLTVSEPRQPEGISGPGERFAEGWQIWSVLGLAGTSSCGRDPLVLAGYLAAKAAADAHHHAMNWMELQP